MVDRGAVVDLGHLAVGRPVLDAKSLPIWEIIKADCLSPSAQLAGPVIAFERLGT